MASPFASSEQPSLFPMTIPVVNISKDEYRLFYQYERALLKIFLLLLHREVVEATLMIGFLLWLERGGYTSYPLGKIFVDNLTAKAIKEVADDVLICVKFLQNKPNKLISEGSSKSYNISKIQCFLDRKRINLVELYHYADLIADEVYCIANDVSVKALDDILEQFQHSPSVRRANQDTKYIKNYQMAHQYKHQQMVALVPPVTDFRQSTYLGQNHAHVGGRTLLNSTRMVEREPDEEVPPDDRTIFLTFSKGYPLSENDIIEYFCRTFGDIVQSIHMQPVEAGTQPLFARIVVRNPSSLKAVTEKSGLYGKSKYVIKGKHVWARKFVPRTP